VSRSHGGNLPPDPKEKVREKGKRGREKKKATVSRGRLKKEEKNGSLFGAIPSLKTRAKVSKFLREKNGKRPYLAPVIVRAVKSMLQPRNPILSKKKKGVSNPVGNLTPSGIRKVERERKSQ